MDKLDKYRTIIKQVLTEHYQLAESTNLPHENVLIFDDEHGHYLFMFMGWNKDERLKSTMIHLRLKNDKIWIEEDWTEDGVATDLLAAGLTHQEMVLAFHPPQIRHHTEFAVA
ncbi:MAG: XisI protein [Spirulinaceae cyanobacterium]